MGNIITYFKELFFIDSPEIHFEEWQPSPKLIKPKTKNIYFDIDDWIETNDKNKNNIR
jgi:hypothetical protein